MLRRFTTGTGRERTPASSWSRFARGIAVATAFALGPVLYVELTPNYVDGRPLLIGSILLASWFGGIRAGIFTTFATAVLAAYYFTSPYETFASGKADDGYLLGYIVMGLALNGFNLWRRSTETRLMRARDQLDRLHRSTSALLSAQDEQTAATITLTESIRSVPARAGLVYHGSSDELELVASQGVDDDVSEEWTLERDTPVRKAYFLQRPVISRGRQDIAALSPGLSQWLARHNLDTVMAIPLTGRLRHGVICLFFRPGTRLRRAEIALAETFANQCAQALDRLDLLTSTGIQAEDSRLLSEASLMLTETETNEDAIAARLARFCSEHLQATTFVFDLRAGDGCLVPTAITSASGASLLGGETHGIPVESSLIGSVARSGRGRLYLAIPEETRWAATDSERGSAVVVPIASQDEVMGVLLVQRDAGRQFDASHAGLVQDIARRGALAFVAARQREAALHELERRREVEEDLRNNQTLLEDALNAKDEFLGMVSHELRTPLTTIRGNADILRRRRDIPDDLRLQSLSDIASNSERLTRIVENMLFLARLEVGSQIELEPVQLPRLVRHICDDFLREAPEAQLNLDTGSGPAIIAGHEDYIRQILHNLLSNALKYNKPGAPIDIAIEQRDDQVALTVADRGRGIDTKLANELFKPFYRHPRTASQTSGLGIGLTVCKRLAEAQGGFVEAKRRKGGGSIFSFVAPLLADAESISA